MRRARAWVPLVASLTTVVELAPASPVAAASCTRSATMPAPPAKGAVLWSPLDTASTAPNTLVLELGDTFTDITNCPPASSPWAISVAPGGALVFEGAVTFGPGGPTGGNPGIAPWGALDVVAGSGPIAYQPPPDRDGNAWASTTSVAVVDPATLVNTWGSCRRCLLANRDISLPGPPSGIGGAALLNFGGDLTGAQLQGATRNGGSQAVASVVVAIGAAATTTSTTTTVQPTTTPTTAAASTPGGSSSPLSLTGAQIGGPVTAGAVLTGLGATAVLTSRRRRRGPA